MSHHRTLDPQPGGFGLQTLIPLADGRLIPATEIITGTMLEGNRLVTETYRMWMREAVEFNGSIYSPVNAIEWQGTFKKIADILDTDPNHRVLGRTQMICLATNDHRIETPIGLMVDFWISDARRQMIRKRSLGLTFCLRCRRAILRLTEIYAGVLRWGLRGSFSGTMA